MNLMLWTLGHEEAWQERAAILEYDAHMTREQAEQEADRLIPGRPDSDQ